MKSNTEIRILLVEDDPIAQRFGLSLMEHMAYYKIDIANTAKQACKMAAENHYDLILMDIGLPDSSGLATTETIRATAGPNKETPIVALTSHKDNAHQNQAKWVGMTDYLEKPLQEKKLERLLDLYVHTPLELIKNRLSNGPREAR